MFTAVFDKKDKQNSKLSSISEFQASSLPNIDISPKQANKIPKFHTEKQAFDEIYMKVSHVQRFYNERAKKEIVGAITERYKVNHQPISIVDLCCGDGQPTFRIAQALLQEGVIIQKIVGYDISENLIGLANRNNTFPQISFKRLNIEELVDIEIYDYAICLFGLHWMNDLEVSVKAIHRSLKKDGILLAVIPYQMKDLYYLRSNFVKYSKWHSAFAQSFKNLRHFYFDKEGYVPTLSKYFNILHEQVKQDKFKFPREKFITFLQSWFQEVRHLTAEVNHELKKDAIAKGYLSDFIDSIDNRSKDVFAKEDGGIFYRQQIFHFSGSKK